MWTLRAGGRDGPRHSSTVPFLQPPHCPRIAPRHHPECLSALATRLVRITRVPQAPPGPSGVIESYGLGPGQLCQGPLLTDSSSSSEYVWRLPSPAHGAVPCPFSSGGRVAFPMACRPDVSDFSSSSSTVCHSDLSSLQI